MNCFMCLESSSVMLNIFLDKFLFCPITIISNYFWFTPSINNPMICANCWSASENFHLFYLKIQEVHKQPMKIEQQTDIKNSETENFSEAQDVSIEPSPFNNCPDSDDSDNLQSDVTIKTELSASNIKNIDEEVEVKDIKIEPNLDLKDEDVSIDLDIRLEEDKKLTNFVTKKDENIKVNNKSREDDEKIASFVTLNCSICSLILPTFGKLKTHSKKAHNANAYATCCERKYYKKHLMIDHINTHLNPEHFKCLTCSKTFLSKKAHIDHNSIFHSDVTVKYPCDQCDKIFSAKKTLKAHKRTHKPKEEWNFKCSYPECDKIFASSEFLSSHVNSVHKKFTRICEMCGKTLNSNTFRKHMQKHQGIVEGKVQCHICNLFLHKKYVKIHIRNHEEAKEDHICPTCGKRSPNGKALYKHIYEVHRNRKELPCTVCKKIFRSKYLLSQHVPTHTGENNFECIFCNRLFKFKSNLHEHKKKEHPIDFEKERESRKKLILENQIKKENLKKKLNT